MSSKSLSECVYKLISPGYDILDRTLFRGKEGNPREALSEMIPDKKCRVLDMCCGTGTNGLSIAMKRPKATVVGLDRSQSMLRKARQKVIRHGLKNMKLICRDAADTGFKDELFDYVVIGLVLHECTPELWNSILSEAHRVLKKDGRLFVLDWDRQNTPGRRCIFAPMYLVETLGTPRYFKEYYNSDKAKFFSAYGFMAEENVKCRYSFVISLKKTEAVEKDPYLKKTYSK